VGQAGHGLLGFDEGEGADLAVGFEYLLHTVLLSAAGTAARDVVGLMVALAAIPAPAIMKTIETQPWYSNWAVETMALPTVSPVARYPVRFAEGVVMPSPELRPVAADRGQAIVAMMPMTTAVAKGFHRFSVSRWASPRFLGGSAAIGVLSLRA